MEPRSEPTSTTAPLICLVMIVKNEASSLRKTIESVQADVAVIVDTGSTDGTTEIVRSIPGAILVERPFIDFATTRNLSLRIASETGAIFGLILSGDETLVSNGEGSPVELLRNFCEAHRDGDTGAFNVLVESGGVRFDSARLVKLPAGSDDQWRFVSESGVHEVLMKDGEGRAELRVHGVCIFHDSANEDHEKKRSRLYRDLEMLRKQLANNPLDTRAWFYAAQTLEDLGLRAQAIEYYKRRVSMEGYAEERYEAQYRVARNSLILQKPWFEVQQMYLDAHGLDPRRAEPLFEIANGWRSVENWPLAYLFASRGAVMPYPAACKLFVQEAVYRWKLAELAATAAFAIGEFETGETFARKALAGSPENVSLQNLVEKFEARKKDAFR